MLLKPYSLIRFLQRETIKKSRSYSSKTPVLTNEVGNNAAIILNRPKSLNAMALCLQMELYKTLKLFENEKSFIILKGAGDKAFSAGGDLLKLKEAWKNKDHKYLEQKCLYMNAIIYFIHKYQIPVVVLMNGITFGAGAGTAAVAKYRIATEKTRFAMPEAKIAFHPNAGGTYFLNRFPGKLGYYLGLTGNSLSGSDTVRVGFATHFCNSTNLKGLEEELLSCSSTKNIEAIIDSYCERDIPELSLNPLMDQINNCFSERSVEEIFKKLEQDNSAWAQKTLSTLSRYSPTSLKVILTQLHKGRNMSLLECLLMECNATINFYSYNDVIEGTRIVLEDRNDTPKWNPSKLCDVSEALINDHFLPTLEEQQRQFFKEIDDSR